MKQCVIWEFSKSIVFISLALSSEYLRNIRFWLHLTNLQTLISRSKIWKLAITKKNHVRKLTFLWFFALLHWMKIWKILLESKIASERILISVNYSMKSEIFFSIFSNLFLRIKESMLISEFEIAFFDFLAEVNDILKLIIFKFIVFKFSFSLVRFESWSLL